MSGQQQSPNPMDVTGSMPPPMRATTWCGSDTNRDEQGLPGSMDTRDEQGLPGYTDTRDEQGLPGSTDTRDEQGLPGSTDTRDEQGLPGSTDTRDEQGLPGSTDTRDEQGLPGYVRGTTCSTETTRDTSGLPTRFVPGGHARETGPSRPTAPEPVIHTSSQINIKVVTCNVLYEPYYRQHCKSADVMQGSERSAVMQAFFHRLLSTDTPDFVALQEYNDKEMAFLSVFKNYILVATQSKSDTCAILYRKDRFQTVGRPTYHLFNIGKSTKCCLLQLFEAVENRSIRVGIASTHVPFSVDPVERNVFFTTLSKQFRFLHGLYIVCGDFNTEISPVGSASFPTSRWRDAIPGKPTARVASGVKKLDYVLYTPATGVTLNGDCVVYPTDVGSSCLPHAPGETISRLGEPYFSDHAVVICNFTIEEKKN